MINKYHQSLRGSTTAQNMQKREKQIRRKIVLIGILFLLAVSVTYYFKDTFLYFGNKTPKWHSTTLKQGDIKKFVLNELYGLGIKKEWVSVKKKKIKNSVERVISIKVPQEIPLVYCNLRIHQLIASTDGVIKYVHEDTEKKRLVLAIGSSNDPFQVFLLEKNRLLHKPHALMALVIGNFGKSFDKNVEEFLSLKRVLTISIIPGAKHSQKIAQYARANGSEMLLCLSLGTSKQRPQNSGEYVIYDFYSPKKVEQVILKGLENLKGCAGVTTTMRPVPVNNKNFIAGVFNIIEKKSILYYDVSNTIRVHMQKRYKSSLLKQILPNSIIIDENKNHAYIKQQLERLTLIAFKEGKVVGKASINKVTLAVIKEMIPRLKQQGIEFVFASQLI